MIPKVFKIKTQIQINKKVFLLSLGRVKDAEDAQTIFCTKRQNLKYLTVYQEPVRRRE